MFCSKCGKKIPENDKFCSSCGESIGVDKVVLNKGTSPEQTAGDEVKVDNRPYDKMAIAGLITGILSLFLHGFSYLALIFSILALAQLSKNEKEQGKGMAAIGLTLGIVYGIIYPFIVYMGSKGY